MITVRGRSGLDVATCGVANATGFGPLATNFSRVVASLATAISTSYFIYIFFLFPRIMTDRNELMLTVNLKECKDNIVLNFLSVSCTKPFKPPLQ